MVQNNYKARSISILMLMNTILKCYTQSFLSITPVRWSSELHKQLHSEH